MASSTTVLVEIVCGELGIDASKPMVERVRAAARKVGIEFVGVRATTEALAAQLLPVTQVERSDSSDDDVVLTHVTTPRSKARAALAAAVRRGEVLTVDDSELRRPPAWYSREKHLSTRKLVVSLVESRLQTLARGGACVVRNARNFPRAARLVEFRLLCGAASLVAYRDQSTLEVRVKTELRLLRDRPGAASGVPTAAPAPAATAPAVAASAPAPAPAAPAAPLVSVAPLALPAVPPPAPVPVPAPTPGADRQPVAPAPASAAPANVSPTAANHLPAAPPPPTSSWLPPARLKLAPGVVVDCRGPAGGSAGARRAPRRRPPVSTGRSDLAAALAASRRSLADEERRRLQAAAAASLRDRVAAEAVPSLRPAPPPAAPTPVEHVPSVEPPANIAPSEPTPAVLLPREQAPAPPTDPVPPAAEPEPAPAVSVAPTAPPEPVPAVLTTPAPPTPMVTEPPAASVPQAPAVPEPPAVPVLAMPTPPPPMESAAAPVATEPPIVSVPPPVSPAPVPAAVRRPPLAAPAPPTAMPRPPVAPRAAAADALRREARSDRRRVEKAARRDPLAAVCANWRRPPGPDDVPACVYCDDAYRGVVHNSGAGADAFFYCCTCDKHFTRREADVYASRKISFYAGTPCPPRSG